MSSAFTIRSLGASVWVALSLSLAAGCGGSKAHAGAPSSAAAYDQPADAAEEPTSSLDASPRSYGNVGEAERDLDRFARALGVDVRIATGSEDAVAPPAPGPSAGTEGGDTGGVTVPTPGGGTVAPERPTPQPKPQATPKGGAASRKSDCATTCKALASLRRAGAAICELAGEDDERCVRARDVIDKGEARAKSCGCPSDDE